MQSTHATHVSAYVAHALALCPVTVSHQSVARTHTHIDRVDDIVECESHNYKADFGRLWQPFWGKWGGAIPQCKAVLWAKLWPLTYTNYV